MSKARINKTNKRQSSKTDRSTAARAARERKTVENKARRLFATLKRSEGKDIAAADALVDLAARFPFVKNLEV